MSDDGVYRRRVLQALGAGSVVGLAGCVDDILDGDDDTDDTGDFGTPEATPTQEEREDDNSDDGESTPEPSLGLELNLEYDEPLGRLDEVTANVSWDEEGEPDNADILVDKPGFNNSETLENGDSFTMGPPGEYNTITTAEHNGIEETVEKTLERNGYTIEELKQNNQRNIQQIIELIPQQDSHYGTQWFDVETARMVQKEFGIKAEEQPYLYYSVFDPAETVIDPEELDFAFVSGGMRCFRFNEVDTESFIPKMQENGEYRETHKGHEIFMYDVADSEATGTFIEDQNIFMTSIFGRDYVVEITRRAIDVIENDYPSVAEETKKEEYQEYDWQNTDVFEPVTLTTCVNTDPSIHFEESISGDRDVPSSRQDSDVESTILVYRLDEDDMEFREEVYAERPSGEIELYNTPWNLTPEDALPDFHFKITED